MTLYWSLLLVVMKDMDWASISRVEFKVAENGNNQEVLPQMFWHKEQEKLYFITFGSSEFPFRRDFHIRTSLTHVNKNWIEISACKRCLRA